MSKETPAPPAPPIDASTEAAAQLILQTRMMIKAGISFEDVRMRPAVNQLGIWPQLVFDLQRDDSGKYDVEVRVNEVDHVVDFHMALDSIPEGEELAKRAGALVQWCQQLLGEDWVVHVQNRKSKRGKYKVIFKGDRLVPLEAVPPRLEGAPFPVAVTSFRRYRNDSKKHFGFDDNTPLTPIKPK